jgi:hypothetical protein
VTKYRWGNSELRQLATSPFAALLASLVLFGRADGDTASRALGVSYHALEASSEVPLIADGGTSKDVNGIELWVTGGPARPYQVVGIVTVKLPDRVEELDEAGVETIARVGAGVARQAGADALIPEYEVDDDFFRLLNVRRQGIGVAAALKAYKSLSAIKYIATAANPSSAPQHRDFPRFSDGTLVPNGVGVPVRLVHSPNPAGFHPRGSSGTAVVKVCVSAEHVPTLSTEIVDSSGIKAVDTAAILIAQSRKYEAGHAGGRLFGDCRLMKATFH